MLFLLRYCTTIKCNKLSPDKSASMMPHIVTRNYRNNTKFCKEVSETESKFDFLMDSEVSNFERLL